jgi:DsbC/DsbD-like thiol-disulfide interchange protein
MRRRSSATSSKRSAVSVAAGAAAAVVLVAGALDAHTGGRTPAAAPAKTLTKAASYLTVTAAIAPVAIAPGGRVVLAADIRPKPGIHVYAPGSQYRAVTIKLVADSPFRLEAALEYPKPALYTFKPLNEQVLVYNAPFRLTAQLGLDPSKPLVTPLQRPTSISLEASLDYQACDDRVCYLPESVPLRWPVTILPSRRP